MCADILCADDSNCNQANKTCTACIEEIPEGGTYKGCQNKSVEVGDAKSENLKQLTCLKWDDPRILTYLDTKPAEERSANEQKEHEAYVKSLTAYIASLASVHNNCRSIQKKNGSPGCYADNTRSGDASNVNIIFIACDPVGVKDCAKGDGDLIKWGDHKTTKLCHCGDLKNLCNKNEGHNYCYDRTCNAAKKEEAPGSATEEGMSAMKIAALVTTGVVVVALIGGAVWYFTRAPPRKRARRARRARR